MSTPRITGLRPSRTRSIVRTGSALGLAALLGGMVACSDAPSAVTSPAPRGPSLSISPTTGSTTANTLLWRTPVSEVSASRVIGPAGGVLTLSSGLRLVVPAGAVADDVTFSVTRLPGRIVAYDFQPHGTTFAVPVRIEHSIGNVDPTALRLAGSIRGAYFPAPTALDQSAGTATVTELRPTFVNTDARSVAFTVDHFSGYTVVWGRRDQTSEEGQ